MLIGIAGVGMVGSAVKYGFEKLGHDVRCHDIKYTDSKFEDILNTEIVYLCLPTNANSDGSCDTSIVESYIERLADSNYQGIIAIKSTVEPGFTDSMIKKYSFGFDTDPHPSDDGRRVTRICFVPEFLRERCANSDFTENHDLLAIGTKFESAFKAIVTCHGKYPKAVVMLSPTEAELLKYYSNVFNAIRIIFANEMFEVSDKLGADYTKIKDAFMLRRTAVDMYMDVNDNFRGYGGYCLPKDVQAMAHLVRRLELDLDLFDCIDRENKKFKITVPEGMRL